MTDLVPIRKGKSTQVSLTELQDRLDARQQIAETRSVTSSRKSRVEEAKRTFKVDPTATLNDIRYWARALVESFDRETTLETIPLTEKQIRNLSSEFYKLEKLKTQIEALEGRYRELIFAHLDETGPKILGRPASQVPGKVEAYDSEPHYVFERRGGNRANPNLDTQSLRNALPEELAAQVYLTVHHDPVPAWDEEVFDEGRFGDLVDQGKIDLDIVAEHLTPGQWRTPSFYKTLVDGGEK